MGILESLTGAGKAKRAAQEAAAANRLEANNAYNTAYNLQNPFYQSGTQAHGVLTDLAGLNGQGAANAAGNLYQTTPGYEFRLNEGIRALNNSAAGKGVLNTGGTLKAAQRYGQDYATGDYTNWYNRIAGLSQSGQNAANSLTNARYNTAGLVNTANTNEGNAIANAALANGSVLSGLLTGGLSMLTGGMTGGINPFNLFGSSGGSTTRNPYINNTDPWQGLR